MRRGLRRRSSERGRASAATSVRIKADENIPTRVIQLLRERGQDVVTVQEEDLVGAPDRLLAQAAAHEDRILITLDRGFADVRRYPRGSHPGTFVVHARDLRPGVILMLVATFLAEHVFEDFMGFNVVIEPGPAAPYGHSCLVSPTCPSRRWER